MQHALGFERDLALNIVTESVSFVLTAVVLAGTLNWLRERDQNVRSNRAASLIEAQTDSCLSASFLVGLGLARVWQDSVDDTATVGKEHRVSVVLDPLRLLDRQANDLQVVFAASANRLDVRAHERLAAELLAILDLRRELSELSAFAREVDAGSAMLRLYFNRWAGSIFLARQGLRLAADRLVERGIAPIELKALFLDREDINDLLFDDELPRRIAGSNLVCTGNLWSKANKRAYE